MSASSESTQRADGDDTPNRVQCLYCGTRNFRSAAACWQCGRPLQPLSAGAAAKPTLGVVSPFPPTAPPGQAQSSVSGDNSLAVKAAVALALTFPYVAVPVGIVFLMLDDPRKARLGWITIGWSLAGTAANIVLFAITLGPLLALFKSLLSSTGHSGGLPGLPTSGTDPGDLFDLISTAWFCYGKNSYFVMNVCSFSTAFVLACVYSAAITGIV